MPEISIQSVQSLFIEMYFNQTPLSSGTGFIVSSPGGLLLLTNRHNVTGRRQDNDKPLSSTGGIPNRIRIWRNDRTNLAGWKPSIRELYNDDGGPKWREHPTLGAGADFIALPVDEPFDTQSYPYSTSTPDNEMIIRPAESVSVIGFPFGQSAGGLFPIWVSGFIASEPDIDYDGKPVFLIDCRTGPGQSGSPVIAIKYDMVKFKSGGLAMGGGPVSEFLGIYSGRINDQSNIGLVWKRKAIDELVQSIQPQK